MCEVGREWTRTHAFFVIMGGFALHDADKSFLRVLDEHTFKQIALKEELEWPTITKKEIQDRSKADIFSKGIVLIQTTWFVVQCTSRFATELAVTELEVVTLAFAVLNGITYWLWWDKPSDVRCAVPVYLKSAENSPNSESKVSKTCQQRDTTISPSMKGKGFLASFRDSFRRSRDKHSLITTTFYTLLWAPMKVIFGPLFSLATGRQDRIPDDDVTRIPTFYSPDEKKTLLEVSPSFWTMIGVIGVFGAIHFIPWSSTFPSTAEERLWRVSAIVITGGPLLASFLMVICLWVSKPVLENIFMASANVTFYILQPLYIISRLILLILPLILPRNLSPTALRELKWSEFFPHI